MLVILVMLAEMTTPSLLKVKIFCNKDYEVTIFIRDVMNKILARHSNFIVDAVM